MKYLRDFSSLHKEDASIAGGKGASLGEMTNASIKVPPGFVIVAGAFDAFLESTNIKADIEAILHKTHHDVMHEVENASEEIKEIILSQELPDDLRDDILASYKTLGSKYIAVRSSATAEDGAEHAWAGQLDTYLNTTEDQLLEHVKKCWASLFTPRAIFYRFEKGLAATHISVAVVVQKMVESEYSGIAFSVHPVTEDENQMIIEAGYGLGEAIVSGQVTPDSYVVTKSPREIVDINVSNQTRALYRAASGGNEWKELGAEGEKQVLTQEQILELGTMIIQIENHYGFPCDIEWAYEQGEFYITQSRPITTLSNLANKDNTVSPPTKYYKQFSREYSLAIIECWSKGESTDPRQYTDKVQPYLPYLVFVNEQGIVSCYMDERGIDFCKKELSDAMKKDKEFVSTITETFKNKLSKTKEIWERGSIENHSELISILTETRDAWPWFEALWWSVDMVENQKDSQRLLALREWGEGIGFTTDELVVAFLEKSYPQIGSLVRYISYDEIVQETIPDISVLEARKQHYIYVSGTLYILESTKDIEAKLGIVLQDNVIVKAANSYVGEVDISKENVLARIFTREYSIFTFYYWMEDILHQLPEWMSVDNMLILSEGDHNERAGVYYTNPDLVQTFSNLQKLVTTTDYFEKMEKHFIETLQPVNPALDVLKKNPTHKNLQSFVDIFFKWYAKNVSVMHSLVDLEGIDPSIKERAIKYRNETQDLDASLSSIVNDALLKLHPEYKDLIWYVLPEEVALLEQGLSESKKQEILKRKTDGWFFLNGTFYIGKDTLPKVLSEKGLVLESDQPENTNTLTGATAYKGKVQGKVKVIVSKKDLADFKEGEVLVTAMTNPDFISAMKQASAVVTDEGGMTCHASIVARELKIPCIVGTKSGTKVLKDGDLVEVDADSGVVRVLEKKLHPEAKDYSCTFEAEQIPVLFEELVSKVYMPGDSLTIFSHGSARSLTAKDTIVRMKDEGAKIFSDKDATLGIIQNLKDAIQEQYIFLEKYSQIKTLSAANATEFFNLVDKMNFGGLPFNSEYTDGAYEQAGEITECLSLVEEYKNVYREEYNNFFFDEKGVFITFLSLLGKQYNIEINDLQWCLQEEIFHIIDGKPVPYDKIADRKLAYVFYKNTSNELIFYAGKAAQDFIEIFKDTIPKVADVIVGRRAHGTGKVKGVVSIINSDYFNGTTNERIQKMNPGNVLVSTTTAPDLMEAMKKSSAIITDVGGMLSHAAITARELGIPCIIGTEFASKVLKDGDMVEIDVDSGTIRLIK
jgi:phosphoenolpyruvate synthase/pyruvate phosphate dikinase